MQEQIERAQERRPLADAERPRKSRQSAAGREERDRGFDVAFAAVELIAHPGTR